MSEYATYGIGSLTVLTKPVELKKLRAVGQKVFIRPDKPDEKTQGGIFLAQNHQHPPCSGVVVFCGPGIHNRKGGFVPTELKPGDRVSYRWITAEQINSNVKWNGEELKVMNADELVGVVEP